MPAGDPAEEWIPDDDEGTQCFFCATRPAETAYRLDESMLWAPGIGGFSLGGPLLTCARCRDLFEGGADDELVALAAASSGDDQVPPAVGAGSARCSAGRRAAPAPRRTPGGPEPPPRPS